MQNSTKMHTHIMYFVGENSIVIISGANMHLTEDDVRAAKDVITSASVVVCQLEIKPEVTQLALSIAKKAGGISHHVTEVLS